MEAAINDDAVGAPKRVVDLLQTGVRTLDQTSLDGKLLAPHRPTFVEDRVSRHAAQFAGVAVLNCKLKVVAWIGLVDARELQTEMLPNFGKLLLRIRNAKAEIIDPKYALLFLRERRRRIVGGGGKMVPQKGRSGQDSERFTARDRRDAEFREFSFD